MFDEQDVAGTTSDPSRKNGPVDPGGLARRPTDAPLHLLPGSPSIAPVGPERNEHQSEDYGNHGDPERYVAISEPTRPESERDADGQADQDDEGTLEEESPRGLPNRPVVRGAVHGCEGTPCESAPRTDSERWCSTSPARAERPGIVDAGRVGALPMLHGTRRRLTPTAEP